MKVKFESKISLTQILTNVIWHFCNLKHLKNENACGDHSEKTRITTKAIQTFESNFS